MLEGFGYKVLRAGDGVEAVEIFERENIDLVLLDVVMPRISSPETYRQMRALKVDLPTIFITGHDFKSEVHELDTDSHRNSICVLRKPYSKAQLGQEIGQFLGC